MATDQPGFNRWYDHQLGPCKCPVATRETDQYQRDDGRYPISFKIVESYCRSKA